MADMINLNADIAEGWGAYDIGNDAELMKIIKSASVACGFHAGDPNTMHRLCMMAKELGVSVGVHPGFNDLWGFGRRRIQMKPADLEYMTAYQIGALQAMAAYAGLKVTHLKAHGALNNMAAEDESYAMAIGRAIKAVDKSIIYVALYGSQMQKAAEKLGVPMALEGFPDRRYDDDGNLAARSIPDTVLKDPKAAAEQALRMVRDGEIVALSGKRIKVKVPHPVRARRRGDRRGRGARHPQGAGGCRYSRRAPPRHEALGEAGPRAIRQAHPRDHRRHRHAGLGPGAAPGRGGLRDRAGLALGREGAGGRPRAQRPGGELRRRAAPAMPRPPRRRASSSSRCRGRARRQILDEIAPHVAGKLVVDTTVPLVPPRVARVQLPPEHSAALAAQKRLGAGRAAGGGFPQRRRPQAADGRGHRLRRSRVRRRPQRPRGRAGAGQGRRACAACTPARSPTRWRPRR